MNEPRSHPPQEDDELDELYYVLSNPRRLHVLYALYEKGGAFDDLDSLTNHLAAHENHKPPHQLTPRERKCVYVSLQQTHIPILRETDAIRVDPETGSIALSDRSYHLGRLLGWSTDTRRYRRYLSLAVGSSLFYLAVLGNVLPYDWVTPFGAGLVIILLFGALAVLEPRLVREPWPRPP